jgi:hypothetical protein
MSREQWGHGYYQGRREAFQPEVLRSWVAVYDDEGELLRAGRVVQNYPEDRILLEYWDPVDLGIFMSFGLTPGQEIDEDSLVEVMVTPACKFFASWYGFINDIAPAIWELIKEVRA